MNPPCTPITRLRDLCPFSYRGAIFDFDGTLADSLDVWKRVDDLFFSRRGLTYNPDYAEKLSTLGFEDGARYTIETYGLTDTPEAICKEWNELGCELYRTEVQLRPGAESYLRTLKQQGVPIALATTNDPSVIEAARPHIPLDELFPTRVHGCEVAHRTKDHPDIYLEAARRIAVEPCDCVVFEDLPTGIETAHAAGMTTVAVITGSTQQDVDRLVHHADYVIDSWLVFDNLKEE